MLGRSYIGGSGAEMRALMRERLRALRVPLRQLAVATAIAMAIAGCQCQWQSGALAPLFPSKLNSSPKAKASSAAWLGVGAWVLAGAGCNCHH